MLFRLLNGDYFHFEDGTSMEEARGILANELNVPEDRLSIQIIHSDHSEHSDKDELVVYSVVVTVPTVRIPQVRIADLSQFGCMFLAVCTNEYILDEFLPLIDRFPTLLANSHPRVVNIIREKLETQNWLVQHRLWLSINSSPVIIEWLSANPNFRDMRGLCDNVHPQAGKWLREMFISHNHLNINLVVWLHHSTDPPLIDWLWEKLPTFMKSNMVYASTDCEYLLEKFSRDYKAVRGMYSIYIQTCPDDRFADRIIEEMQGGYVGWTGFIIPFDRHPNQRVMDALQRSRCQKQRAYEPDAVYNEYADLTYMTKDISVLGKMAERTPEWAANRLRDLLEVKDEDDREEEDEDRNEEERKEETQQIRKQERKIQQVLRLLDAVSVMGDVCVETNFI